MKLSIVLTTYNLEQYIAECLNSIMPQMTDDCELIIVDDYSKDRTKQIIIDTLKAYNTKNHIRIFHKINEGVSGARNSGTRIAQGEYIAFIDGDDTVGRNYINEITKAIKSKNDYYELSWKNICEPKLTHYAGRLPQWNKAVWARVYNRAIIKIEFKHGCEWGEDGLFNRENLKEGMTRGIIEPVIYNYRNERKGSLTEKYTKGAKG